MKKIDSKIHIPVRNMGERLQELFEKETWREHFNAISESLGFSLSVFSDTGVIIFISPDTAPLCSGFRSSSSEFNSRCASDCTSRMMNTLATGKPDIFKCYAKIVCFALPLEFLGEKAIILGQGSFASYEDFRDCMDLVSAYGIDKVTIKTPLAFTGSQQAQKTCRFVTDSVNRLLMNMQETFLLKKKVDSLKSILSLWDSSAVDKPELRYQNMLYNLSSLLDIDRIMVFAFDKRRRGYVGLYGLSKNGAQIDAMSIASEDQIVKDLQSGKPYLHTHRSAAGPSDDASDDSTPWFYFPITISGNLAGILAVADQGFTENDAQIISGFCKQTALFIENHRLRQDLHKKFNRFIAMMDLTRTIAPIQNYETLLQTILDKSAELLKAEQGSLMLLDYETDELLLEAKRGVVDGVTQKLRINRGEGIAGKVAEDGEALLVENLENDPRIKQKNRKHYKTRSFVCVPLKVDDRIIGVINLSDKTTGEVFDEEDLMLIKSFATHAVILMERNVFLNKTEELKKLTITDPLTGLLNRRYLYERLKDEVSRSQRYAHSLSLLMLDMDGFKYCNDTFGHLFGDRTLQDIANTLLNTVRSMDIVARYGGDEFMVILPETGGAMANEIAERIRSSMADKLIFPPEQNGIEAATRALSVSIGIVCYPQHGETVEQLLENVDKALYRAKNNGKNSIEVFS
jgi:diguanylate cyclase (GGDEF)-like protein